LEAAGMASLIKVLLAMQHGTIPPAANFEVPNPAIPWDRIPFLVPRAAEPWPASADGTPRRAAIDSFGIGGLNTHLVVDQVPEAAATFAPDPAVLNGSQSAEPIAIIGIGCVLPGAFDVAALERIVQSPATPSTEGHAVSSPSKS